ncbi:MAG: TonB-dependent receptor [Gammaproteobacteria bacterium]|nr:TonB-dependent receptor [Pseudomonadales bacterium]
MSTSKVPLYIVLPLALTSQFSAAQEPTEVQEITVIGRQEFLETQFTARREASTVDAAKLINQVPGGGAASNGPLTGQIQYRGMQGPRVNVRVDGMLIHGGGPNWMAPPLHHIPAALMEELVVEQGIPSIATGGGIGGAVTGVWKRPAFNSGDGWNFSGDTEAGFSSVDGGTSLAGVFGASTRNHRLYLQASLDEGDNYDTPNGEVAATQYDRRMLGLGYGFQSGIHEFDINFHRLHTDDTGTPSLPMDIDWFDTDMWNAVYRTQLDSLGIEARVYGSSVDHGMSNYLLRTAPDFSSLPLPPFAGDDKRRVLADSQETGYKLTFDMPLGVGDLTFGLEGKTGEENATVYDPDFGPFFVDNFSNIDVNSQSLFAQWSATLNRQWYVEAGIRKARVKMEAGEVDAFPAKLVDMNPDMWPMGTPPRAVWMLREGFNAGDRSKQDHNTDVVLKARYQMSDNLVVELGAAQKQRSPIYQERFLWIPLEANAGVGDGNNYVGDPNLDPESSLQFELGLDWDFGNWYFSPRFYRRKVDDFIQGVPATDMAVIGVSKNANGDPTPLMFANTEATFHGIDLTYGFELSDLWRVEGLATYVRGERDDINDNLFRITPPSYHATLIYDSSDFVARIEEVFTDRQNHLSATNTLDPDNPNNSFVPTDSYWLTNVNLSWYVNSNLTLTAGAENLFDEDYIDPLSGFNRVLGSHIPQGSQLYGTGRNLFGRLQYNW